RNDLTPAAMSVEPQLAEFMAELRSRWGQPVLLTGSGSGCFGMFPGLDEAVDAAGAVSDLCRVSVGVEPRPRGVAEGFVDQGRWAASPGLLTWATALTGSNLTSPIQVPGTEYQVLRLGGGVTGSTTGFGPVRVGSSPAPPASEQEARRLSTHVVILAAGQGKRMFSPMPKVAQEVAGRPLVRWVIDAAAALDPDSVVVVVGHGADRVREVLPPRVRTAFQEEQLGTGHATGVALAELGELDPHDVVVILYGDTPMLGSELISELASLEADEALRMVTADLDDPSGYGRVLRDDNGNVVGV